MKLICSMLVSILFSSLALAQTQNTYFSLFDRKVYSLKTKGVRDFVVDVKSSQLLEQVNEQKSFGHIKELVFRVHWTLSPERIAVDVIGLPEGFTEAKNALRENFMPLLDNLLPMNVEHRFPGYQISPSKTKREFIAKDTTGLAPIPKYLIRFDDLDRLSEIIGLKPVGAWNMNWIYEKKAFSDGKWVISQVTVINSEGGLTVKTTRKLNYGTEQGIGVLKEVVLTGEQSGEKSFRTQQNVEFTNYKINTGEGMRYFLNEAPAASPKGKP
jgi:hypothetical protein